MAKFDLILKIYDRDGDPVFIDKVEGGTNRNQDMISKPHLGQAIAKLEAMADSFRKGNRIIIDSTPKDLEIIEVGEELLIKIAKRIVGEIKPQLKRKKPTYYIEVKDTKIETVKRSKLNLIYKKEES